MANTGQIKTWKDAVRPILAYFLERTPGNKIQERHCSILWHYKDAEDPEGAARQAAECASYINGACEAQRAHAFPCGRSVVVEPMNQTKKAAAQNVYENLINKNSSPIDFLMVVGDGREDEKVFRQANSLGGEPVLNVVTVSLSNRSTEATATMTHGVSGIFMKASGFRPPDSYLWLASTSP